ncbi:MAG: hypothetical protein EOP02_14915, partial [Proteobacteria bacterium]
MGVDTLILRVAAIAHRSPEAVAIVDGEKRVSYAGFWQQARQFAALLLEQGIRRGDRVAVVLPNRIEAAVACYGAWLLGAVVVPLNVQAKQRDLSPWLRHCGARFVLHEARNSEALAALADAPSAYSLGLAGDHWELPPVTRGIDDDGLSTSSDLAMILYTSGTTGTPKGVMLSHGNLASNVESILDYLELTPADSVMSLLPFYYAYGASVMHTHLASGACLHLAPNLLFPHQIVETMARERITGFSGVPSTFMLLLDRVQLDQYDLRALRYLTQAGGAMSPALTLRLRKALPG